MTRFAMMIRSKINRGSYDFVANVFNMLSSRLVANYDYVDGSSKDGVMFEVVRMQSKRLGDSMRIAKENGSNNSKMEWMRMGSFSFDSTSIKCDPHSHELTGFAEESLKEDVLLRELDSLDTSSSSTKGLRPVLSQQFMVFMFTLWDVDNIKIKSVVAQYSTESGIKVYFLVPRIQEIITSLSIYEFIVNNVCGDGATENRSSFKQIATMTVRDIFEPRCIVCTVTARESIQLSVLNNLHNENLPIAFVPSCDENQKYVLGGRCHIG